MDDDDEATLTLKQWEQSDRETNIVCQSESITVFIEALCCQIENLTIHDFIATHSQLFCLPAKPI